MKIFRAVPFLHLLLTVLLLHGMNVPWVATSFGAQGVESKDEFSPLFEAAKQGDSKELEKLITGGVSVNTLDGNGFSPLFYAAKANSLSCVELLLNHKADPDLHGPAGHVALAVACMHEDLKILRLLIETGASLNVANMHGWTAMHEAAYYDRVEAVRLLIENGADLDRTTRYLQTPLRVAAQENSIEVAKLLFKVTVLDRKAQIEPYDFADAMHFSSFEVAHMFIDAGADVNFDGINRELPLKYAAAAGRLDLLKLLLEKGALVSYYDSGLFEAIKNGHEDCAELLFSLDAHLTTKDWQELQKILPEQGRATEFIALVRRRFFNDETKPELPTVSPIHLSEDGLLLIAAASHGDTQKVKQLLEAVPESDFQAVTFAYTFAEKQGRIDVRRLLASRYKKAERAERIWNRLQDRFYRAVEVGNLEDVKKHLADGAVAMGDDAFKGNPLQKAASKGHVEIARLLIEKGAPFKHGIDGLSYSPLYSAAMGGSVEVVKMLVEAGADPNHRCRYELFSAVAVAASGGHKDVVAYLIDQGADIEALSFRQSTALLDAAEKGHAEIVQLLLDNGARIDAIDRDGQTAWSLAESQGHRAVVEVIAKKIGLKLSDLEAVKPDKLPNPLIDGYMTPPPDRVRELLKAGADPNQPSEPRKPYGFVYYPLQLPLMMGTITKQRLEVVKLLLEAGANPNQPQGLLARVEGSTEEGLEVVRLMVKAGADVDKPDPLSLHQMRPLTAAAVRGNREQVLLLIELGADPTAKNPRGETVLEAVRSSNILAEPKKTRMIKLLAQLTEQWIKEHGQSNESTGEAGK